MGIMGHRIPKRSRRVLMSRNIGQLDTYFHTVIECSGCTGTFCIASRQRNRLIVNLQRIEKPVIARYGRAVCSNPCFNFELQVVTDRNIALVR